MNNPKLWTSLEVKDIYEMPFNDLLYEAHRVHLQHHPKNNLQLATLLSIKTGACPEDCGYCSQSGHYQTDVEKEKLLPIAEVLVQAKKAKERGAKRFCMGAAWRSPPTKV